VITSLVALVQYFRSHLDLLAILVVGQHQHRGWPQLRPSRLPLEADPEGRL